MGEQAKSYSLSTTASEDVKPGSLAGSVNGGLFPVKPDWPVQYPSVVIVVESILETMDKVKQNGGEALGEPTNIPNFGKYVSFLDTEGNRNSIIQPLSR